MKALLLFVSSALFLYACDFYDHRFKVVNKSNGSIAVATYEDTIPCYPSPGKAEYYLGARLEPGDTMDFVKSGKNGWPNAIKNSKNQRLNVIIYNIDSIGKYRNIDTLIMRKIYSRLVFSEDHLEAMDWMVVVE